MGFIREIVDIKDALTDIDPVEKQVEVKRILKNRSISKWAKDANLQFPVIVSDSLSIEAGEKVANALEKNYASLVEFIVNITAKTDASSPEEFLRGIHQNFSDDRGEDIAAAINSISESSNELGNISSDALRADVETEFNERKKPLADLADSKDIKLTNEDILIVKSVADQLAGAVEDFEELKPVDIEGELIAEEKLTILKSIDKDKFYSYKGCIVTVNETMGTYTVGIPVMINESAMVYAKNSDIYFKSVHDKLGHILRRSEIQKGNESLNEEHLSYLNMGLVNEANRRPLIRKKPAKSLSEAGGSSTSKLTVNVDTGRSNSGGTNDKGLQRSKISDREIKMHNNLMPTVIEMEVIFMDAGDKPTRIMFNVGVKCVLHPVSSVDMVDNLSDAARNRGRFFNFIRWTTGEIAFFRDFLFSIDSIKTDAVNMSISKSAWWTTLKKRKKLSNIKRNILAKNQLIPNATIMINSSEVDYIKNVNNIDLRDVRTVKKIMDDYFLLGFIIVDEELEHLEIIYDSDTSYQSHTFRSLERSSASTNTTKDLLKLMTRM